jgi:hypothetical protein
MSTRPALRMLTDRSTEYCGDPSASGSRRRCFTSSIGWRFRNKIYPSIDALQADLDSWIAG